MWRRPVYKVNYPSPNFEDAVRTGNTKELAAIIEQLVRAVKELQALLAAHTAP